MMSANISNEKKSIIWVCGANCATDRDWCTMHMAFHTEEEAKDHLDNCAEGFDKCDYFREVELIG